MSRGVFTLATGAKRYIDQDVNLGRSIRFHNPDVPIAIVADSSDAVLDGFFDSIYAFRPELGSVFRQKLFLTEVLDDSPAIRRLVEQGGCRSAAYPSANHGCVPAAITGPPRTPILFYTRHRRAKLPIRTNRSEERYVEPR
jgi:hypothetical protein